MQLNKRNVLPSKLSKILKGEYELKGISKMSLADRDFLWNIVVNIQPKNSIELGSYGGGSSLIILNACKNLKNATLYTNDILSKYPRYPDKELSYAVDTFYPELAHKQKLLAGSDISEQIEKLEALEEKFDFAFIDTGHFHPCECLNLISILPFMKEDSWVVLHDIGLYYCQEGHWKYHNSYATKYIWDVWCGEKKCTDSDELFGIPNMGAIKVENIYENKKKLLSILFNKWDAQIPESMIASVRSIIKKHYEPEFLEYYDLIIARKKRIAHEINKIERESIKLTKKNIAVRMHSSCKKKITKLKELFKKLLRPCEPNLKKTVDSSEDLTKNCYDIAFYKTASDRGYTSGKIILSMIQNLYQFDSVVDVGCGIGTWLKASQDLGASIILGYDGNVVNEEDLYVPRKKINIVNLENFIASTDTKFDLAISLEVAEHLKKESSVDFVENLTRLSDVVLFSAAIPFQGGRNHINCQPLSFWVDLFSKKDYVCFDFIRKELMDYDEVISPWYIQNILLFVHKSKKNMFTSHNIKENANPLMFYHWSYVKSIQSSNR